MKLLKVTTPLMLISLPNTALAQVDSGDTAWLLISTALVLFMTVPGLSLFYGGLVRSKNALSVLMQCFTITCLTALVWLVAGYSLSFSDGGGWNHLVGGLDQIFLKSLTRDSVSGTIPESVFVMFQLTFATIAVALIVGGFVERMRFLAVILFTLVWLLLVYFPICHMVWGGGWMGDYGVLDFAGGTAVHLTAGVAALVCALMVKPRHGFPVTPMPPHNLVITVIGASMLWIGWFGFNAGSAVAAGADAGMAMLVTHICTATAALTWIGIEYIKRGKPSVLGIVTGMVAGLVTITPASGFVGPMGALAIGIAAGVVCFYATQLIKVVLHIDDSLDVFPVHGVGGALGTVLTGIFAAEGLGGAGMDTSIGEQVMIQLTAVGFVVAWTLIFTWITLKLVSFVTPLRVGQEDEIEGLDITQHEEISYHL